MRYGQKGGDGPNTGKKAVTYLATTPDGRELRKRNFNPPVGADGQPLAVCTAALIPPSHGRDWSFWVVAPSREAMPDYPGMDTAVFVEAKLLGAV